jgi:Ricin-type beta-trefoil lectin domain-like
MKKGLFSLLGLVAFIAIALLPATSFAATSTRTAQSHKVHIFHSRGHAQPPKAASTTIGSNVPYQGGPVMANTANVYAIFWEPGSNVSANYNSLIERYFNDVGGSPLYKINNQYKQTSGAFPLNAVLAGTLVDTTSPYPESPLLDLDIQNEVTHAQQVNTSWLSGIDNVFFVFTEKNEGLCIDSSHAICTPDVPTPPNTSPFCAYHGSFGTNNTIYAAMPYTASPNFNFGCTTGAVFGLTGSSPNSDDADQTINATSHEQMEAATDPYPIVNPAWQDTTNKVEIGDLCAFTFGPGNPQGADVLLNNNPYIVQQEWSNAISGCTLTTNTAPKYYQIKNRNSGLVMDVSGGGTNAGAQVIQWPYHSGANQQWAFVPDGTFLQIKNRNSGLVLDVSGGSTNALANVIQWTNHNGLNQQWLLVPDGGYDAIVNVNSGLVADVSGGSTSAGAHVIQYGFHNGLNQQWASIPLNPYYEIVNRNSGLVADVSGASTSAGAHVIQWPYHGGLNQQWALVPDGAFFQIMNLHSGLVMDVSGGSTSAGAQVIQWTNHNGLNQQWSLVTDGTFVQIVNRNSGLVLDVFGGGTTGGVNVIQWTNHNGLNQQWSLIPTSA